MTCVFISVCLTKATTIAGHDHERPQASSDDALRSPQWWLFKGTCILVKEGVDAVGRWRTTVPHYGLCRRRQHFFKNVDKNLSV